MNESFWRNNANHKLWPNSFGETYFFGNYFIMHSICWCSTIKLTLSAKCDFIAMQLKKLSMQQKRNRKEFSCSAKRWQFGAANGNNMVECEYKKWPHFINLIFGLASFVMKTFEKFVCVEISNEVSIQFNSVLNFLPNHKTHAVWYMKRRPNSLFFPRWMKFLAQNENVKNQIKWNSTMHSKQMEG